MQALRVAHAVVTFASEDECGGGEILHRCRRIPLLIELAVPGLTAEFVVGEPEFLGSAPHRRSVIESHHRCQALETLSVTLQPVHHVTTVAPSHACHAVGVNVAQPRQGVGGEHHVLKDLSAPVLGDGGAVSLATTRRAVGVGVCYHITGARIYLPVGTERVHPLHLRPAVYVHHQRVTLVGVKVVRLDDEDFHAVARSSLDPQFLRGAEVYFGFQSVVVVGELGGAILFHFVTIECVGFASGAAGKEEITLRVGDGSAGGDIGHLADDLASGKSQFVDGHISTHIGCEINLAAITTPGKVLDPVIKGWRNDAIRTGLTVVKRKLEAVALIAWGGLATVGDIMPVGTIKWGPIPCLVGTCYVAGLAAIDTHQPQVGIGRCLGMAVMVRHIAQFAAIRREGEQTVTAGGEQQGLCARSEVTHLIGLEVVNHQMRHTAVTILSPVTIEQTVGDVCLNASGVLAVAAGDCVLSVGTKFGVHFCREGHIATARRDDAIGDTQLVVCEQSFLACSKVVIKQLHQAIWSLVKIVDFAAIGIPHGAIAVFASDDVGGSRAIDL